MAGEQTQNWADFSSAKSLVPLSTTKCNEVAKVIAFKRSEIPKKKKSYPVCARWDEKNMSSVVQSRAAAAAAAVTQGS